MINQIVERLHGIEGDSIFLESIKFGLRSGQHDLIIDMIKDQTIDNRNLVSSIIGENLLRDIEIL